MSSDLTDLDVNINTLALRHGLDVTSILMSVLKVQEETGELSDAVARYFGYGVVERKPTVDFGQVSLEILDVATAALVLYAMFQKGMPSDVVTVQSALMEHMENLVVTRPN